MSGLQECKGNGFFEVGQAGNNIWLGPENLEFLNGPLPLPDSTSDHEKFGGGGSLTSSDHKLLILNKFVKNKHEDPEQDTLVTYDSCINFPHLKPRDLIGHP